MRTEVRESDQVRGFVRALSPDQREKLRAAMRGLAADQGDIKVLVDELTGYLRLRVGNFRVVYREQVQAGVRLRKCLFVERRDVVYELFRKMVLDDVRSRQ